MAAPLQHFHGIDAAMPPTPPRIAFGRAWLALVLALHVADEATHGFLPVYNAAVTEIRIHARWLPLPTFTFGVWIAGLILGIALLLAFTRFAYRGSSWIRRLAYPLSVLMFGNGLLHLGSSLYVRALLPGVYTAPLLLFTSAWLFAAAVRPPMVGNHE